MSNKPAARKDDDLIHSSIFADITSIIVEGAAYAAIGAAVGVAATAAAPLAGAGVAAAGLTAIGSSCVLSGIIGGVLANVAGITDDISHFASGVGDFLFPPSVSGKISSGSGNVLTNQKMAARAAGKQLPAGTDTPEEQSPLSFLDYGRKLLNSLEQIANAFWQPSVAGPAENTETCQQDTAACEKHSGPQFMAEGSSSVLINGQPAIRAGDRTTCEATVADNVSPDVIIGGESVVVREIKSGKTPGLALAMMVLPLLRGRPGQVMRNLPCVVSGAIGGMAADMLVNALFSSSHPVHAATGVKVLNDENDLDFTLPGRFPLAWQRNYNSRSTTEGLFGTGWTTVFDTRLEVTGSDCLWFDESGRELRFSMPAENEPLYSPADGLIFRRGPGGELAIADDDGSVWRLYRPLRASPQLLQLASLSDEYGNMLETGYDEQGRLVRIHDAPGAIDVQIDYADPRFPQRVTSLSHYDGTTTWPLMTYSYADSGQLAQVTDAAGIVTREFSYNEQALMTAHRLPGGMLCEYRWQHFDAWRVVAARDSAGDSCTLHYDLAAGQTTVTHADGRQHQHVWNAQALVTRYVDERGGSWLYDWDENQQLTRAVDPSGNAVSFRYDDAGNRVEERDAAGHVRTTQWLETRALPVCITDAGGAATRFIYDERYGLAQVFSAGGCVEALARDEHGQVISRTDAAGGVSRYDYNRAGQVVAATDCSGFTTRYGYHPLGWLAEEVAADGETTRHTCDAAGRPVRLERAEGWEESLHWNERGQPAAHRGADGRESRFRYDAAGRLVVTRNPQGDEVRREYDSRSRLTGLINENGERYGFTWGADALLLEERGLDGGLTRYAYDAVGRVVRRTFAADTPAAFSHVFRYDARGLVTGKGTPDGETRFAWSATGQLLRAAFHPASAGEVTDAAAQVVTFQYDEQGQLTEETGDRGTVAYRRDALGNRTGTTLPDGRTLRQLYYGSGHLLGIALDGLTVTEFTRDSLHRETGRTQGGLMSRVRYDRLGRLRERDVFRGTQQRPAPRVWSARWQHDYRNNLIREERDDNPFAWRQWQYDAAGRLLNQGGSLPDGEQWRWDAASNPLDAGVTQVAHNRVTRLHGATYRYDPHGRVAEKVGGGTRWRYRYDGEHRLTSAESETRSGVQTQVSFVYDPLGRRISKTSRRARQGEAPGHPRTTYFVWEGLRLLQEIRGDVPLTYVYADPDSYEPLARIDGVSDPAIYWYHCAPNGTPERLTDAAGGVCWQGDNSAWGKLLREAPLKGPVYPQNLRMQGQYLDRETGLHYTLFRYYDPDCGRFTQPDPIGLAGGLNLYQYAPNALGWVDPWGLSKCSNNGRSDPYKGAKDASAYLRSKGVDRDTRKQIINSFELDTISVQKAGNNQFGTRFHDYGKSAWPLGQYVFETFTPLTNRSGLALPYDWNRMTGIKQWQIKPGSTIIRGRAAPQFKYGPQFSGGEEQIFVLQPWKYGTLL